MPRVTKIVPNGNFTGKYGVMYKFTYEFDDNVLLVASHKTEQSPFKIGDAVEYEIRGEYNGIKEGKVSKPNDFGKGGQVSPETQKRIDASWAIGQALTIGVTQTEEQLLNTAQWLLECRNKLIEKL